MKISTTKRPISRYVPKAAGNREMPEAERFSVDITPMGVAEFTAARMPFLARLTAEKEADRSAAASDFRDSIVIGHVGNVKGLEGDAGEILSSTSLVEAAKQANDAAWNGLLDELYTAITDASVLAEGVAKN
jgi:hypothetical protein